MPIPHDDHRAESYSARLAAIQAAINGVRGAPYEFGQHGPHRKRRDEDILLSFAADIHARMIEARI
jgi:hypothetical protein